MNYRYRVDNADIIVSPEEDQKIKNDIKAGKSICFLRNDMLAINVNFIRYIKETDSLTEEQEHNREEVKKLPEQTEKTYQEKRASGQGFLRITHEEFYARMKWEHKPDCVCKIKQAANKPKED